MFESEKLTRVTLWLGKNTFIARCVGVLMFHSLVDKRPTGCNRPVLASVQCAICPKVYLGAVTRVASPLCSELCAILYHFGHLIRCPKSQI